MRWLCDRLWEACCFFINKSVQAPVSKPSFNLALMMISLTWLPKANDRNCTGCDTEDQNNNITIEAYCRKSTLPFPSLGWMLYNGVCHFHFNSPYFLRHFLGDPYFSCICRVLQGEATETVLLLCSLFSFFLLMPGI